MLTKTELGSGTWREVSVVSVKVSTVQEASTPSPPHTGCRPVLRPQPVLGPQAVRHVPSPQIQAPGGSCLEMASVGPPSQQRPPLQGPGPRLSTPPCLLIVLVRVLAARVSLRGIVLGGQTVFFKGEAPETLSIRGRAPGKGARRKSYSTVTVGGTPPFPFTPPVHPLVTAPSSALEPQGLAAQGGRKNLGSGSLSWGQGWRWPWHGVPEACTLMLPHHT